MGQNEYRAKPHISTQAGFRTEPFNKKNDTVRAEFGRLPLLFNGHLAVWSYIKYLKNKDGQVLVKKAFQLDIQKDFSNFATADLAYSP